MPTMVGCPHRHQRGIVTLCFGRPMKPAKASVFLDLRVLLGGVRVTPREICVPGHETKKRRSKDPPQNISTSNSPQFQLLIVRHGPCGRRGPDSHAQQPELSSRLRQLQQRGCVALFLTSSPFRFG
ncbi:uncharacterized protein PV07_12553 [Cladophialophora immunda]|uniref:Uncharacterized protein n=1 Tax=Cladophialophora immunda TaxID=569365 RepID=A0A0D2BSQ0_9EURO|nr:uncharacterized protein PV07_12553 [Cladophialophora immunda]KIW22048.1 hypothetical protein PV07_12553 [Cladophialophora immunda]